MKIQNDPANPAPSISVDAVAAKSLRADRLAEQAGRTEQPASDSVEIHGVAQRLEVDPARIERLREAVRNGSYVVPASEVSARIVGEHLEDSSTHS